MTKLVSLRLACAGLAGLALAAPTTVAAAADSVLIDQSFSAQTTPANFGFPVGADVAGGVLNLTRQMSNYTTSVKTFDAAIGQARTLDLAFDWKTAVATSGNKTGIELRDSQGISRSLSPATTTALACSRSTTSASPRRRTQRTDSCRGRRCTRSATASCGATATREAL